MHQDKIWEYFQNDSEVSDSAFESSTRYHFIAKHIKTRTDILNIGIGRGGLEEILISKGANTYCLDPSEKSIQRVKDLFGLADRAKVGYSQSIPYADNNFDTVIMTEVLEHLSDDVIKQTLEEVHRVLRSGGRFIGTVPADENLLKQRVVCPDCGKLFHQWGHVQSFSSKQLFQLLDGEFNNVKITRKFLGTWGTLNWKGKISWIIKSIFVTIGMKGDAESFFFTAQKL
jgi:SAM-dependent methyltransferase